MPASTPGLQNALIFLQYRHQQTFFARKEWYKLPLLVSVGGLEYICNAGRRVTPLEEKLACDRDIYRWQFFRSTLCSKSSAPIQYLERLSNKLRAVRSELILYFILL